MKPHLFFLASLLCVLALPVQAADSKPKAKPVATTKKHPSTTGMYTKDNVKLLCTRFKERPRNETCLKRLEPRVGKKLSPADKKHLMQLTEPYEHK